MRGADVQVLQTRTLVVGTSLLVALVLAACADATPSSAETGSAPRAVPGVMVLDGNGGTQPLVEIIPTVASGAPEVEVKWVETDGVLLGIEGTVGFLRSFATDGSVILDRMMETEGRSRYPTPPGEQTLVAYYRTCDGNCSTLDPEEQLCAQVATLESGHAYLLEVSLRTHACRLTRTD
jgi:hypothetical protein